MERSALSLQLGDYRLVTAEIFYHMPDHPGLLQTYIWQDYDLAPRLPILHKFLDFWSRNLDGKLHSIKLAKTEIITASEWRHAGSLLSLH
jgi:uncharacterized protein Usg